MVKIIKKNEARILIYLDNAEDRFKYATQMSQKLKIDYAYLLRNLKDMVEKRWIKRIYRENKVFYQPTDKAPTHKAKDSLL